MSLVDPVINMVLWMTTLVYVIIIGLHFIDLTRGVKSRYMSLKDELIVTAGRFIISLGLTAYIIFWWLHHIVFLNADYVAAEWFSENRYLIWPAKMMIFVGAVLGMGPELRPLFGRKWAYYSALISVGVVAGSIFVNSITVAAQ